MGQDTIFCIECGTANPLNAETCSQCQAGLMPPHPIQLDGGDIYTLKCEKCQARLLIEGIDGFMRCSNCDTYHKIEKGDGYLTIHAVSKISTKDAEAVLAAEDCKPMLLSTLDERLNEMRKTTLNRDLLIRKLNEVDARIFNLNKQIAKARRSRSFGIILIPVGIIGIVAINSTINGGHILIWEWQELLTCYPSCALLLEFFWPSSPILGTKNVDSKVNWQDYPLKQYESTRNWTICRDWQVDDDTKRNLLYSLWICQLS